MAQVPGVAGSLLGACGCRGGCGPSPSVASSAASGTAPNPGSQVRALTLAGQAAVCRSANLTPENRHCRTSPADATVMMDGGGSAGWGCLSTRPTPCGGTGLSYFGSDALPGGTAC